MNDNSSNGYLLVFYVTGFTLIELLITITVLVILVALVMPSFHTALMNNRILAKADALMSSLNYARNTALTQDISVKTCPLGGVGSTTCGANWQNGWIVVSAPPTGNPVLLQTSIAGANDPLVSGTAPNVTFDPRGIATTQVNFKICDNRGSAFAQSINVLPTGFVQLGATVGVAAWDGTTLTCP